MSAQAAEPFFNSYWKPTFEQTPMLSIRGVVWVFQHSRESLVQTDFSDAIARLISYIRRVYLTCLTSWLSRIRQIIQAETARTIAGSNAAKPRPILRRRNIG